MAQVSHYKIKYYKTLQEYFDYSAILLTDDYHFYKSLKDATGGYLVIYKKEIYEKD